MPSSQTIVPGFSMRVRPANAPMCGFARPAAGSRCHMTARGNAVG